MTRTERTYYVVFGFYSLSQWFLAPMYALFLLSRGLDILEMNMVLATYLIVVCLLEVPTGALADIAGRKLSFLLSCAIRVGAFTLYFFAHSFTDCLRAEFIDAVGSTLANGALDAWAVDGMRAEGATDRADYFFARAQMLARSAMIVGGVACGYIGEYDIRLPWLVAATVFALTGIIAALTMNEIRPVVPRRLATVPASLRRTVVQGFMTVRGTPVLLLLCGLSWLTAFAAIPAHMLWQPRMQALTGEGVWLMGWIWALINLASVLGSLLVMRVLSHVSRERLLSVTALWRGTMLAIAALAVHFWPALLGLLGIELGFAISEPLVQAWLNEHISAEQRATVLSVRAMFFTLGGGTGLVCIGLIARDVSIPVAWLTSAVLFVATVPGFVALGRLTKRALQPVKIGPVIPAVPPALG